MGNSEIRSMATEQGSKNRNFVQTFGKKKNATAVAICRAGSGTLRVNGVPIDLVKQYDIRIKVKGGGYTAQIYAIRLALAIAIIAFYQKHLEEFTKREIKEVLIEYDRKLLVADPRRCEPKKFGGRGARARKQMSYR